ncbi:hypothetical protein [Paraglaciecola sp. L3A3]|uniref:hypothetical protein n=1 Tax=Paraglaciecola sp. L3A3 TaxID=2686358 RepID=UPI00131E441F|nr:hypothetical protein [Paraglaciecola sp. L3A3]
MMKTRNSYIFSTLGALLITLPFSVTHASAPFFLENSSINNHFDLISTPSTTVGINHLSLAIDANNKIVTSYQTGTKVDLAISDDQATSLTQDISAPTNIASNSFQQVVVNPMDNSLILAYVQSDGVALKRSFDNGETWSDIPSLLTSGESPALTLADGVTVKHFKMAINNDGVAYLYYGASTSAYNTTSGDLYSYDFSASEPATSWTKETPSQFITGMFGNDGRYKVPFYDLAINPEGLPTFTFRSFAGAYEDPNYGSMPAHRIFHYSKVFNNESQSYEWQLSLTGTVTYPSYLSTAFDADGTLYMFTVLQHANQKGGHVYKSNDQFNNWTLVGQANLVHTLNDTGSAQRATAYATDALDIAFDSQNTPYIAYQQRDNSSALNAPIQIATLSASGEQWVKISYELSDITGGSAATADHDYVNLQVDNLNRPVVYTNTAGDGHDTLGKVLRMNYSKNQGDIPVDVNEGELAVTTLTAIDEDGDDIALSLSGEDADLFTITQETAAITFKKQQIAEFSDETYQVTVNAAASDDVTSVNLIITLKNTTDDFDNDLSPDGIDFNPLDPNTWEDVDADGWGNDANGLGSGYDVDDNDPLRFAEDFDQDGLIDATEDDDDDNDGVLDINDQHPYNSNDESTPIFYLNGTSLLTNDYSFDALAALTIEATGILTNIQSFIEAHIANTGLTTVDLHDAYNQQPIPEIIVAEPQLNKKSGQYTISLTATDSNNNTASIELPIFINPIIEMPTTQLLDAGSYTLTVPFKLLGNAPAYPVVIHYSVSINGTLTDHNIELTNGDSPKVITIDLSAEPVLVAGDNIVITLTEASHADVQENTATTVTIVDEPFAPVVTYNVTQLDADDVEQPISVIGGSSGDVSVKLNISDLNTADTHCVTFDDLSGYLTELPSSQTDNCETKEYYTFNPSSLSLASGNYQLNATVNDSDNLSTTITITLAVDTELTSLLIDSDQDGIPDDFDNAPTDATRLQVSTDQRLDLAVTPGLQLSIGDIALKHGKTTAVVSKLELDIDDYDVHYQALSNINNFKVTGLQKIGESVAVIVPLETIIPEHAIYRKHTQLDGWFDFYIDDQNTLSSATKTADGNCPAPFNSNYELGLNEGYQCIQLVIQDGGKNDADATINGMVSDPGLLVTELDNILPVIETIGDHVATSGQAFNLSAIVSDAENDDLTYTWNQLNADAEVTATIVSDTTEFGKFIAPDVSQETELTFTLTVSDGRDSIVSNEFKVIVTAINVKPVADIYRNSGSFNWIMTLLLLAGLSARNRKSKA